jgi:CheY-like chemotaxis protein
MMQEKILVADEDGSVRRMVARVLELAGYKPLLAGSGPEALAKFTVEKPAMVLLDLSLPGRDGWKIFEQLRCLNPLTAIIAMTAWDHPQAQAVQRGTDALMEKPLDLPLLLKTIHELLEQTEQERAERHSRLSLGLTPA